MSQINDQQPIDYLLQDQNQASTKNVLKTFALVTTLAFIFLIPWGNTIWDGFTRIFGAATIGSAGLLFILHGTHRNYSFFHLFLILFGGWTLLTLLWSPDISYGLVVASTILQLVFISITISLVIDSKDKVRLAYQAYVFGACVGGLIIVYYYVNGIESKYWARYSLENYEPDGVGIILALAVPMAAYLTTQYKSTLFKLANTFAIPLLMFAIFLNATRTASIAAMFGIIYWVFIHRNAKLIIKLTLIVFFISSIIGVIAFAPKASVDRIFSSSKSLSSGSLNGRAAIWSASLNEWQKTPLIGAGIGSLGFVLGRVHVKYNSAHNTFIQILSEIGIIGLTLYLLLIISILYYLQKVPINDKVFILSLLATAITSHMTMNTLYDKEMWLTLTLLAIHAHTVHIQNTRGQLT